MARPLEVKAVVTLLEAPADDVEELAKAVIQTLDEMRSRRPFYTIVTRTPHGYHGNGAYATALQAEKALGAGRAPALQDDRQGVIVIRPEFIEPADPVTECRCGHGKHTHAVVPRIKGCIVGYPVKGYSPLPGAPARCGCPEFTEVVA